MSCFCFVISLILIHFNCQLKLYVKYSTELRTIFPNKEAEVSPTYRNFLKIYRRFILSWDGYVSKYVGYFPSYLFEIISESIANFEKMPYSRNRFSNKSFLALFIINNVDTVNDTPNNGADSSSSMLKHFLFSSVTLMTSMEIEYNK